MTAEEAVEKILDDVAFLESSRKIEDDKLSYYVEKLVYDILDYCHREDFPATLVYTVTDLIRKRLQDEDTETDDTGLAIRGPLSSLKMDDTEYHFGVSSVSAAGSLADQDFDTIKPKLNIYRKVVSW